MAVYSVDQVLKTVEEWEDKLLKFYGLIKNKMKREESQIAIRALEKDQRKLVETLKEIDPKHYENVEFDKSLPNFQNTDIISIPPLNEDATPEEILDVILSFEAQILHIYEFIHEITVYPKPKNLWEMLVQIKTGQIKKIKGLRDGYC